MRLKSLSTATGGVVFGDPEIEISSVCSIEEPIPNALTFSKEKNGSKIARVLGSASCLPGAILVRPQVNHSDLPVGLSGIVVKDPLAAITRVIPFFFKPPPLQAGVHPSAIVASSAVISPSAAIGPFSVVGERCVVEANSVLHPNVVLYPDVKIEPNCVLHAGVVVREGCVIGAGTTIQCGAIIGADGFGYFPEKDGKLTVLTKIPQVGTVKIGTDCEVGANACIDRATLGTTAIGQMTKIDNLVQIGHNTKIGRAAIICGQTGVAGSVKIGDGAILGGAVGVADHLTIGPGVRLGARSGVICDITEPGDYAGFPAVRAFAWRRMIKAQSDTERLSDRKKADSSNSSQILYKAPPQEE